MSQSAVIWFVIAAFLFVLLVYKVFVGKHLRHEHRHGKKRHLHVLEVGSEREMLYINGDINGDDESDV